MRDGIPNDALLGYSWALNQELSRERDAAAEGPRLASPCDGLSLRDQRLFQEHQRREDRRLGIDRRAEEEQRLLNYLRVKFGPSGSVWEPAISDHARRDIEFRDLTGGIIRNWLI